MRRERKQELVENFIRRAGFHEGYNELESQARLIADYAVLELESLKSDAYEENKRLRVEIEDKNNIIKHIYDVVNTAIWKGD